MTTDVLSSGYFNWNKTIEYLTYNITSTLKDGDNVLGVALGKGIYRVDVPIGGRPFR